MAIQPSVNHPINCGLATTANFSRQFVKLPIANRSANIFAVPVMRGIDSFVGTSNEIIGDINWQKQTFPVSVSDCEISIIPINGNFVVRSVKSNNTAILANPTTQDGLRLLYQSNGTVGVEVELTNGEKIADGFIAYTQSNTPIYNFVNHISGSLSKHIFDQMIEIADGSTSSPDHYRIYSTFNFTNNSYIKNINCWAASCDFSGVSVNKIGSGGVTAVTAVTPRHAIGAAHYAPPANPSGGPIVGDKIYFCDTNNTTIERTVVAVQNATSGDARIVKFNADLPATVKKYKLIDSNWKNYLPIDKPSITLPISGHVINYAAMRLPLIAMSHYRWDDDWPYQRPNRYAYIHESGIQWSQFGNQIKKATLDHAGPSANYAGGVFLDYNGVPSGIQGGDSGLPCFYLINGDLVYVIKHLYAESGDFLSDFLTEIQAAINLTGSEGYTLQTTDLSGFTNFSS